MSTALEILPREVLDLIISFIDHLPSLAALARVSKHFNLLSIPLPLCLRDVVLGCDLAVPVTADRIEDLGHLLCWSDISKRRMTGLLDVIRHGILREGEFTSSNCLHTTQRIG